MNRSHRSLYNARLGAWVAVPETAKAQGKPGKAAMALGAVMLLVAPAAVALDASALPSGGQVAVGSGNIVQSGAALTVTQASQNLAVNWQSFNIGSAASVNFVQPNSSAIALNRVIGSGKSEIYGKLGANGQVFLLNPNGVLFGKNAEVNVGGLVASTLGLSDADFLNRNFRFAGTAGSVVNEGSLSGNYVALLGGQVSNQGTIAAKLGTVALAAGSDIRLDFAGDGLIGVAVNQGTLDALAENKQLIRADGGTVLLTAKAAGHLIQAVVNNAGVIEARTVENRGGVIKLLGDMDNGLAKVGGRLDASAPDGGDGGFVETSAAKVGVGETARVTTLAARGRNGTWLIDPADYTIAASGGNISGATLSANLGLGNVVILSSSGTAGGNGDIHVNDAVSWSANDLTLTAARDININAVMTASGTSTLTMNTGTANGADAGVAGGAVRVGFAPGNTGFVGRVDFPGRSGTGFLTINGQGYTVINTPAQLAQIGGDLAGRYALGGNVVISGDWTPLGSMSTPFMGAFNGLGHWVNGYSLSINSGGTDLQGLFGYSTGSLGNVGIYLDQNSLVFGRNYVGALAGANDTGGIIRNVVFMSNEDPSVKGSGEYVGGLVGFNDGTIVNSHVVGSGPYPVGINGVGSVGGLVGYNGGAVYNSSASGFALGVFNAPTSGFGGLVGFNDGAIAGSYAAGVVRPAGGASMVGGLVGGMIMGGSSIVNSYATGTVGWSDASQVGGLVGYMAAGTSVTNSYATAAVTGSSAVGGLVGQRFFTLPSVSNSFWNTETSGQATSDGGTGKTSAQLKQAATFAGWDIAATGGSSAVWRIYEGQTAPLLRSFLTSLTVGVNAVKTYNGTAYSGSSGLTYSVAGANTALIGFGGLAYSGTGVGQTNAGNYTLTAGGLYTNSQYGYDIGYAAGTLRINPAALTISTGNVSKTYDGTTSAAGSAIVTGGTLFGTNSLSGGSFAFANKHAGTNKSVSVSGVTVNDGNGGGNYTVSYADNTASTITPAPLTIGTNNVTKTYDGTTSAPGATASVTGGTQLFGTDTISGGSFAFTNKNAGPVGSRTVSVSGVTVNDGNGGGDYAVSYTTANSTSSTINRAELTIVGGSAANKTYDGTTAATVGGTLAGIVDGALLGLSGTFDWNGNVGTGKTVSFGLTGPDMNYTLVGTITTTADITPKALTLTGGSANNKVYDGTTAATVGGTLTGIIGADGVSLSGAFGTRHVGTGKTVTFGLAGAAAGNYSLAATTTADITPKALTLAGGSAGNKAYDGTTAATVGGTLSGVVGGDGLSLTGAFDTRHVGMGKTVAFGLGGVDAGNYSLSATTTANITPASLTLSTSNVTKTYDGTTSAAGSAIVTGGALFGADSLSGGSFAFANKNVGSNKSVSVSGVTVNDGNGGGNYAVSYANNIASAITPASLTLSTNNVTKTYDGTTSAAGSAIVTGGALFGADSLSGGSFAFANKNVGSNKSVSVSGVTVNDGNGGGNYAVSYANNIASAITQATLTLTGGSAGNKAYDGTTAATVGGTLSGVIGGDGLSLSGAFDTRHVGMGKTVTFGLAGADAGNYSLSAATTANIAPYLVSLAGSRVFDGKTTVDAGIFRLGTLPANETLTLTGSGTVADAVVGANKPVALGTLALGDGTGRASNYTLASGTHLASITAFQNDTYDGALASTFRNYVPQTLLRRERSDNAATNKGTDVARHFVTWKSGPWSNLEDILDIVDNGIRLPDISMTVGGE